MRLRQLGKFLRFWFPVFLYSGIIFWASSQENVDIPIWGNWPIDKLLHIIEYAIFGFLVSRAVHGTNGLWAMRKVLWVTLIAAILYGLSDEFHQSMVEGRDASYGDFLVDIIGGWLGSIIFFIKS